MIEKYFELKRRLRWWLIWKLIGRSIQGQVLRQANTWYESETDTLEKYMMFKMKWLYCPAANFLDSSNVTLAALKLRCIPDFTGNVINFELLFSEDKK